jgi:hypothetical protein
VVIGLPQVFGPGQDLQIGRNMQSAHDFAADRNDVIDIVLNACLSRQSRRFFVKRPDHLRADPGGAAFALGHQPSNGVRDNLGGIGFGPRLVGLARSLSVFGTPLLPLLLAFRSVLRVPRDVCVWVCFSPLGGVGVNALYTSVRSAVDRCATYVKGVERLIGLAVAACLNAAVRQFGLVGSFRNERWLAPVADARFANIGCSASASVGPDRLEFAAFGETRQRLYFPTRAARFGVWYFDSAHFPSLCASTMRLTSSAMEMPRRLASFFKKDLCGSVKEIICLVIYSACGFAVNANKCEGSQHRLFRHVCPTSSSGLSGRTSESKTIRWHLWNLLLTLSRPYSPFALPVVMPCQIRHPESSFEHRSSTRSIGDLVIEWYGFAIVKMIPQGIQYRSAYAG